MVGFEFGESKKNPDKVDKVALYSLCSLKIRYL